MMTNSQTLAMFYIDLIGVYRYTHKYNQVWVDSRVIVFP